jgi:6-phosphogluconolactonase
VNLKLHTFPHANALDQALAACVAASLHAGIATHGTAALAVSGGRTPAGFFRALSALDVDWAKVTITLADERCVGEDSPHSNARSVRTHLLQGAAAAATFLPLYAPNESIDALNTWLAVLPAQFDAVVLGMGEDGHTASIFPDSPQRDAALLDPHAPIALAVQGKEPVTARITLSAHRLLATRSLILHITGDTKWTVLGQALQASTPALPISHFLHAENTKKHVFWTR